MDPCKIGTVPFNCTYTSVQFRSIFQQTKQEIWLYDDLCPRTLRQEGLACTGKRAWIPGSAARRREKLKTCSTNPPNQISFWDLSGAHMVVILDDNSEKSVHLWSNLGYVICLRHLFRSSAVTNLSLYFRSVLFSFTRAHRVLSYHLV